jgi:hypothetical protein
MSEPRSRAFSFVTVAFCLLPFALLGALPSGSADAHPMGNFSINHYSGLAVSHEEIRLRYILDFAEIPTFQEMQALDRDHDGEVTSAERDHYLSEKAAALVAGLRLQIKDTLLVLRPESSDLAVIPGAGGLPTIKVSILYHAAMGDAAPGKERVQRAKSRSWPARDWEGETSRPGHGKEARPTGQEPAPAGLGRVGEMAPGDRAGEIAGENEVFYRDQNYLGRAGWKEMTVTGLPGTKIIGSTLPANGSELRSYPEDEIKSPPQIVETRFSFLFHPPSPEPAGSPTQPQARRDALLSHVTGSVPVVQAGVESGESSLTGLRSVPKATSRWSESLASLITVNAPGSPMILLSLLVAFGLGTIHALSPGHGKTVVAAYLVGSRGTARHALLLGATVTVSHTIGVFLLGLATLYLSKFFVPERLYPWLGFFSGLSIFMIGLILLRQRWQSTRDGMPFHDHDHPHGGHDDPDHSHHHHHHGDGSLRGIVGLGITGGIVPCPSALVVLLSAIAFHQIAFGLLLIVAFSAGIAATLVLGSWWSMSEGSWVG